MPALACLLLFASACARLPERHGKGGLDTLPAGADKAARVEKYRQLEITPGGTHFDGYGERWDVEELGEYIYAAGYAHPERFGHDKNKVRWSYVLPPLSLAAVSGLYLFSAREEAAGMAAGFFGGALLVLNTAFWRHARSFEPSKVAAQYNLRLMRDLELQPQDLEQP